MQLLGLSGRTWLAGPADMERILRPGSYLNAVEIGDGNTLLYNGFSMCMDVVPSDVARELVACEEGGDLSFLLPAEREHLVGRGHLTELSVTDELEAMREFARAIAKRDAESDRRHSRGKMITFVLTYQCNLSCAYCYQKEVRKNSSLSSMSETFVDEFFGSYLHKLLPGVREDDLSFTLYGGEPLLPANRGAIERILHYAKKHGIVVSTVTNAVLLPRMLDLIGPEKGKVNNVQVTLDGGRMFHDEQRVSLSGGPTFGQTVSAIRELMKAGANAVIRVHIHPERLESARALVDHLEGEKILGHDRVKIYFWSTEDIHKDILSPREYELFSRLFHHVTLKQYSPPTAHFAFLKQIMDLQDAGRRPVRRHCDICVTGLHSVVDPAGDIYECIDDAGHRDRRTGTLAGGEVEAFARGKDFEKPHLSDKPACLECSVALFCGGGCINRLKARNDAPPESFCLQVKEFVGLTLKSYFLLKQHIAATHST